jgi:hypothetical protein
MRISSPFIAATSQCNFKKGHGPMQRVVLRMEERQWKEDSGETTKAENLLL